MTSLALPCRLMGRKSCGPRQKVGPFTVMCEHCRKDAAASLPWPNPTLTPSARGKAEPHTCKRTGGGQLSGACPHQIIKSTSLARYSSPMTAHAHYGCIKGVSI